MRRALSLAAGGLYSSMPNPRVGCVIVREGQIVGEGFHYRAGEAHAEVNALAMAGDAAAGATAYVTLEPCSHIGRTPPCANALIKAGVGKVVVAMVDPNPAVAGRGIELLRQAGIEVSTGVLSAQAEALNPGFCLRMRQQRPLLRLKQAMSLDGRTAMASGESQWITGPEARADVQRWRARSCAILTGIGTVLQDDPALTVRAEQLPLENAAQIAARQPLRVILDSQLRLPVTARVLQQPGQTLVITASEDQARSEALQQAGAELHHLPGVAVGEPLPWLPILQLLAQRQCNEVLVEAGPRVAASLLTSSYLDEWLIYLAPTLLGESAMPLLSLPLTKMAEQRRLNIDSITAVGADWRIQARPSSSTTNKQHG